MSNLENQEKYILLDNLFNLYLDTKYDNEDEVWLKEGDINFNAIVQKNMMLFRQLKTKAKAELNQAKYNRVKEFLSKLKENVSSDIEKYKQIADALFTKEKYAELQPMFRNLKEVSEKDKNAIIVDSKLLDILAEIEDEYNKQNTNE